MKSEIGEQLKNLKSASRLLAEVEPEEVDRLLNDLADRIEDRSGQLLAANQKDLDRMNPVDPKYDRLMLDEKRIAGIAQDIRSLTILKSPVGRILESRDLENGLSLQKISVPIGVICIVFESRPNVTLDVFSICFKSGNACVLKGSQDAWFSNRWIVETIRGLLADNGLPDIVYLTPPEREALRPVLEASHLIDAIIPRGGRGLIDYVRAHSKVPVIETGAGIVHTYVDKSADLEKSMRIVSNAKTRRVSVCNALDTLIIHSDRLPDLSKLVRGLDKSHNLIIYADQPSYKALIGEYDSRLLMPATEDHFGTEFLSMKMAIVTVQNIEEALDHIDKFSSMHSEAIIAEDQKAIKKFQKRVDAAVVYVNTSTAFTDGAQFGLGAEIGISTQKLHARGPMALNELTSYKWLVTSDGHIRP